ncbi:MAG: ABC-F family ATP-binding cassette domain-containing protein [Clostridia bacterium]|nr:ABC-F family ATP-binding cassette domain-containing protein [Clostridia bacterium]
MNIDRKLLDVSYNDLSGGEKTLIQLAKALLIKPDLLLLDEPTNHLDIARIEWLEQYIKSFKGASVIVSHDRYFLDKMSNQILDIDNGEAKVYHTNYSGFLEEKKSNFEKQMADFKSQQELIKKLEAEKKYFAERGMATNSYTLTARAHVLQNRIDRIKANAIQRPKVHKKISAEFEEERKSSKRVITVKDLTVKAPDKVILDNISIDILSGERVAFIGANGS